MYTVKMEQECKCFKKSEYTNNVSFETQQDAYKYATTVAEFMNEEFCGKHNFTAHKGEGDYFVIAVTINPEAVGIRHHVSCDVGCSATDEWSLEANDKSDGKNLSQ